MLPPVSLFELQKNTASYFSQFSPRFQNCPAYLSAVKALAAEHLAATVFPSTKNEAWKYTNLRPLLDTDFSFFTPPDEALVSRTQIEQPGIRRNRLVFVNGIYRPNHSQIEESMQPMVKNATDTASAPLIKKYLSLKEKAENAPFVSLNTAFFEGAILLDIPKNYRFEEPLEILHIYNTADANLLAQPRIFVHLAENSALQLSERHQTAGSNALLINAVTDAEIASNAEFTHTIFQNMPKDSSFVNTLRVLQQRDSRYTQNTVSVSGKIIRNNLDITLAGSGAEAYMNGLYVLKSRTHLDNHTSVNHREPHTYSNQLYKGIIDEQAKGVFNGKIYVQQKAQKTNAFQANNNILLSDKASIDTKPQLEIWADDVKCSHGATIGALDAESLFYLQSRGIPKAKATALLLEAFANDIAQRIDDESIKEEIVKVIRKRFQ